MTGEAQYLVALYRAERELSPPIPPSRVAETLDRSPAATTEMLQRLEARGLVSHEPYEGATLTAEGRATAADLHDTYRTLARFCREVLDLDDYEEEAMRLTGNVSPTVAERLATTLLASEGTADQEVPPQSPRSE
ncbi:metal-dependent transcriptional regulator [Halosimplex aquaticum]|uniref:Metal-dependent transcriptional regulator n=1 Tax=Halosimplex aquaticum TaxID=3026162 RepID=A0ABD5Y2I5_9EURY|nr:metal-dependent transcriptional regulator [Halosimplex aquaticum]